MDDLRTLWEKYSDLDVEYKFASISDDIWKLGSIEKIKDEVSADVFTFHVAVNMIGNWKGDGWDFIFYEGRALLPYIADTLSRLGLGEIKDAFEETLSVFPDFASDCNEEVYTDVMNFLINPRFKVADERLNAISKEERTTLSEAYHKGVQSLDDLSEKLWGYRAEEGGWKNVLDYLKGRL
jgi:hypothetical protein